jgi:hypothetical protein
MSAQQIKLNIHELVNGFEDEFLLDACYRALEGISKAYQHGIKSRVVKRAKTVQKADSKETVVNTAVEETNVKVSEYTPEKVIPHDLSLVFLANELFKDSQPLPEEAILAFNDALMASALTTPTLPNRL